MKKLLLMLIAALSIMLTSCEPREEVKTGKITVTNNMGFAMSIGLYREGETAYNQALIHITLETSGSFTKTVPVGKYYIDALGGMAILKDYHVTIGEGDEINISIR